MNNIEGMKQSAPITISQNIGDYKVVILPRSGAAVIVECYDNGEYGLAGAACTSPGQLKHLQDVARELGAVFVLWSWSISDYQERARHLFPVGTPRFISSKPLKGPAPTDGSIMDMVRWEGTSRGELRKILEIDSQSPQIFQQLM